MGSCLHKRKLIPQKERFMREKSRLWVSEERNVCDIYGLVYTGNLTLKKISFTAFTGSSYMTSNNVVKQHESDSCVKGCWWSRARGDTGPLESFSPPKHPASDCLNIPFLKPSVSRREKGSVPRDSQTSPCLKNICDSCCVLLLLQCASACRTPAPVSTPRPRACPSGRAECATTCKPHIRLWICCSGAEEKQSLFL